MRISDWSSDVCSSDLLRTALRAADAELRAHVGQLLGGHRPVPHLALGGGDQLFRCTVEAQPTAGHPRQFAGAGFDEIGRASWWARVCQYVQLPVVAASFKKNKHI